jgi:pimeloyl-ACP methyl ester carboxylesterase
MSATVSGRGPNVVLIHGIPGSSRVWASVLERLRPTHRVIALDLIGFGASSRSDQIEDLWADRQAEAAQLLLADLDVQGATIVGHDFGGPVAAYLVDSNPRLVAGLVLASTNAFADTPVPFPLSAVRWPVLGRAWERILFSRPSLRLMIRRGVGPQGPHLHPSTYLGDRDQARAIGIIFSRALRELQERYAPITELLARVRIPTRVLWGDRDPFFPIAQAKRTGALIPGAEVSILPGAGHFLPDERPAAVAEAVAAVVREAANPARFSSERVAAMG